MTMPANPELAMVIAQERAGYNSALLSEELRTKFTIAFQAGWYAAEAYYEERGGIFPCQHV